MRHQVKKNTLDRLASPRQALISGMAVSLVLYERMTTTKAKAKVVRSYVEKLVTKAKVNNLTNRRYLIAQIKSKNAVNKLLDVLGPRFADRKGGYTRITDLGVRKGDGAQKSFIEFV